MPTSVTVTKKAKRKDGKAKGVIIRKSSVNMNGITIKVIRKRTTEANE